MHEIYAKNTGKKVGDMQCIHAKQTKVKKTPTKSQPNEV